MSIFFRSCALAGFILMAGSCAPSRLPPPAPPAVEMGTMTLGRIVAIRDVAISGGQGGNGLNLVLNALNAGSLAGPESGQEFVIQQNDGTTVAITQNGDPGFAVGDEVGIIASDQTTLIHR